MNNLKVQGYDNLEKDPNSGAIVLAPSSNSITDIRINNLMKKVKKIEAQNEEILQLLRDISNKFVA